MSDHAAKMRDALNAAEFEDPWLADEARAALDAILTERDALKKERDEAERKNGELSKLIMEQEAEYRKGRRAAEATLTRYRNNCPFCGHEWNRHDPEDGMCDAHSKEGLGVCECGRDIEWMQRKIAALSRAALDGPKEEET